MVYSLVQCYKVAGMNDCYLRIFLRISKQQSAEVHACNTGHRSIVNNGWCTAITASAKCLYKISPLSSVGCEVRDAAKTAPRATYNQVQPSFTTRIASSGLQFVCIEGINKLRVGA